VACIHRLLPAVCSFHLLNSEKTRESSSKLSCINYKQEPYGNREAE